jgi:choline dehydrogenase-like flavoprotein
LQDHLLVPIAFEANEGIETAELLQKPGVFEWAMNEWQTRGYGPLAVGAAGTGFFAYNSVEPFTASNSHSERIAKLLDQVDTSALSAGVRKQIEIQKAQHLNSKEADFQLNFSGTGINPKMGEDLSKIFAHGDPGGYAGILAIQTHALSRGSIHIQSPDSKTAPVIDPRYLSHPVEVEVLVTALDLAQKLATTQPLSGMLKDNTEGKGKRIQPAFGVAPAEGLTLEKARELVKATCSTCAHPIGTCAMLPREDGGVVDADLKVYGTSNLRVVDASIFPLHVRGNIASLVYAVAEKAATLI